MIRQCEWRFPYGCFAVDKINPRESADSRILNQNKSKSSRPLVFRIEGVLLSVPTFCKHPRCVATVILLFYTLLFFQVYRVMWFYMAVMRIFMDIETSSLNFPEETIDSLCFI